MKRHLIALAVLLALSILGNIELIAIVRNARAQLARQNYTPVDGRVVPGEAAPPLKVKALDGREVTITARDSQLPTVLYVFSPSCGWCKKNHNSVESLIKSAGARYRFIAISLSRQELPAYLAEYPTGAQVFMEPSSETMQAYGLTATPTTILVSPGGVVKNVWLGAFRRATRTEVGQAFGVELPEILPSPQ